MSILQTRHRWKKQKSCDYPTLFWAWDASRRSLVYHRGSKTGFYASVVKKSHIIVTRRMLSDGMRTISAFNQNVLNPLSNSCYTSTACHEASASHSDSLCFLYPPSLRLITKTKMGVFFEAFPLYLSIVQFSRPNATFVLLLQSLTPLAPNLKVAFWHSTPTNTNLVINVYLHPSQPSKIAWDVHCDRHR